MITAAITACSASEQAIIDTLLTAYPTHGIHAEESGKTRGNPDSDFVWIIDPLDGTTNFIHGFPVYAARPGDTTIYVPIARGMDTLAPYARKK